MKLHWMGTAILVMALGACKKDDQKETKDDQAAGSKSGERSGADQPADQPATAEGGCPALSIKIDGKEVTGLAGFAKSMKNGEYLTEQIELHSDTTMTCERALAGNPNLPADAYLIRAYYHEMAMGFGTEAYTDMSPVKIKLVARGAKDGDRSSMCLPEFSFTPNAGTLSGKKIDVVGLLEAPWCGVQDFTPK